VRRLREAGGDPVADLADAAQADAARDRLATGLVSTEPGQEAGEVDHAGSLVGRDDRAGADVGANRAEGLELVGGVGQLLRQDPARRAADEDRLPAVGPGLAGPGDDLAKRRPDRDLGDAGA